MASNFLEDLVSQWYEFSGYFIRRNILVGRRPAGGHAGELDVVGFNPVTNHLIHIEPSMDTDSWAKREERYSKKFRLGREYIPSLFEGLNLPSEIDQVALLGYASKRNHADLAGGRILLIPELLEEIFSELSILDISRNAIPEHLPILRGYQLASSNFGAIQLGMSRKSKQGEQSVPPKSDRAGG